MRLGQGVTQLSGVLLALGVLWIGVSMPKPGWHAISDRLPSWMKSAEAGVTLFVFSAVLYFGGKVISRSAPNKRIVSCSNQESLRTGESDKGRVSGAQRTKTTETPSDQMAASPIVCCSRFYTGRETPFAAFQAADRSPEAVKKWMQTSAKNRFGRVLSQNDFPLDLKSIERRRKTLPDFFCMSGRIPLVSPRLAKVLQQLNLGDGAFYEARFFAGRGQERLPYTHLFWNLGNRKKALLPEASNVKRVARDPARKIPDNYVPNGSLKDDDLAVSFAALDGPDVWVDPDFPDNVFFSDRFKQLMDESGFGSSFDLQSVRVIPASSV